MPEAADPIAAIRAAREKYRDTADRDALKEALALGRAAISQLAGAGDREGVLALELAAALGESHRADGNPRHLDEALDWLARAQAVLPPGHEDLPTTFGTMAGILLHRFIASGDPRDLQSAVAAAQRAAETSDRDDPRLAGQYANLAGVLRTAYGFTGNTALIDASIAAARYGVEHIQPSTNSRCEIVATLAGSLLTRAGGTLSLDDITAGIATARQAVAYAPHSSPQRVDPVSILATGLRMLFDATGDLASLGEASQLHREMADLVPRLSPERGKHLLNEAATLLTRADRLGLPHDLEIAEATVRQALDCTDRQTRPEAQRMLAVCLQERALALAADGDREDAATVAGQAVAAAERALELTSATETGYLSQVVQVPNAKAARFEITGSAAHRGEAITAYENALASLRDNGPFADLCVVNLGRLYTLASQAGPASRADIGKSIDLFRRALASAAPGQRAWAPAAVGLLKSLVMLFSLDPAAIDVGEATSLYRQIASAPAVPPITRVRAAQLAGPLLLLSDAAEAAAVLAEAVRMLPAIAWRGIDRQSRETQLAGLSGLACDAAACAIIAGDAGAAVEILEQGRNILWADMLQLRQGDAELWRTHPEVASRLHEIAAALNAEETRGEGQAISRAVDQRMTLAAEWERLVAEARAAGMGGFLESAPLAELLPGAAASPVVIVNVSQFRCDALVVTADGVQNVPLPSLRAEDVNDRTAGYLGALARLDRVTAAGHDTEAARQERLAREETLLDLLAWLWDTIAEPVLTATATGYPDGPAQDAPWPRVRWCPTGLLTLLPLHAAGHYASDGHRERRSVLDRVVSSYTPSLKAPAADRMRTPGADTGTLLFVGMPQTPGEKPLPGAGRERDLLRAAFGDRCRTLYGETATTAAVREGMRTCRWAHLSCHGEQNLAAPSRGGLLLRDGALTIADLASASHHGEFAFLAACKTATGGTTLPDEAISLAAALYYTGYRHVLATLWSVDDQAATEVARHVYGEIAADGQLVAEASAHALHEAVRSLREAAPLEPSRWIPFIHIGP